MNVLLMLKNYCTGVALVTGSILLWSTAMAGERLPEHRFDVPAAWQQVQEIQGVVKDAAGKSLPGISITVKGTTNSTFTNGEGGFKVPAKKGDVLVFSGVSYATRELTITDQSFYTVQLTESAATLGDVVVVGYGKQNRKALTSAVTTIKAEDMNRGAISDVGQLLQGKVPGLNISKSGDPNRTAAIILRGSSTLNLAQSPLFVIDGVPGADIALVAPDDIATMDVLKDAAATAIYGNRGANGVIMVTTKRAKKGQLQLSYNGYVGIEKVSNQYDMMDANQLKTFLTKNGQSLAPADDLGANTDWQSAVQRSTAYSHNHNISMGGGTEQTIYNASLNYFDQQGIMNKSGLNRIVARLSIEQKALNDKLKLGIAVTNSVNDADWVPYRNTVLSQSLIYLPTVPVKNADGTYYDNLLGHTNYFNPVSMVENATEKLKYKTLLGSFTAQVKLPAGFTYDLNVSYQSFQTLYGAYYNSYFTKNYNTVRSTPEPPLNPSPITLSGANGEAVRNSYQNTTKILETFFTWDKKFGDHSINAVVGYSWQENVNGDGFQASSTNFPVDNISYNNLTLGNSYAIPAYRVNYGNGLVYEQSRLISDFARVNYNFRNKYLLQGSLRRDGSSAFGLNNQWGYFPSVGAAWRISEEAFMQNQRLFTDLKLRASYGITGNSFGFGQYSALTLYGFNGTFYYNGVNEFAIGALQNENPDLRWEKTATANIGIDFSILKGRISGSVDVYKKTTTDLIWNYPVDPSRYQSPTLTANAGEMSNKGIEVALNTVPVQTKNFTWTAGFNLASNVNKLVKLKGPSLNADSILQVQPGGGGQTGATVQIILTGQPIGQFFTLQYAGKNASGKSQYVDGKGNLTVSPLNKTDYHLAGNAQPKLLLGFVNTFRYKNIDLNIFMRAVLGNKIFNATRADLFRPYEARFNNILVEAANESAADDNAPKYSTRFIENGSYVRLDNATLGYTVKNTGKNIKGLRFYFTANNVFILTSYKGIDPEVNQGGIAPGVDANNFYPKTRTFLFGVNVSL